MRNAFNVKDIIGYINISSANMVKLANKRKHTHYENHKTLLILISTLDVDILTVFEIAINYLEN